MRTSDTTTTKQNRRFPGDGISAASAFFIKFEVTPLQASRRRDHNIHCQQLRDSLF
jgi:hypothetical protein